MNSTCHRCTYRTLALEGTLGDIESHTLTGKGKMASDTDPEQLEVRLKEQQIVESLEC